MGQKIHPNGLRVGINRKWNSSWFETTNNWKNLFFYQKQIEDFFKAFFYLYPYTKKSTTKRVLLVDLKLFKYNSRTLFIFVFFYKFRTKRRKETLKLRKRESDIKKSRRFYSKKIVNSYNLNS